MGDTFGCHYIDVVKPMSVRLNVDLVLTPFVRETVEMGLVKDPTMIVAFNQVSYQRSNGSESPRENTICGGYFKPL